MDRDEYEIVREFECCGKKMVIVKLPTGTHIMPLAEWRWTYGMLHPER